MCQLIISIVQNSDFVNRLKVGGDIARLTAEMKNVNADTLFLLRAAALTHDIGIHIC